jgi:hypothetical protein
MSYIFVLNIIQIEMKLIEFFNQFPDEQSCVSTFMKYREQEGVVCKSVEIISTTGLSQKNFMSVNHVIFG